MDERLELEPDLTDTRHMKFVDGRCSCCPYGYHVDVDFLRFLKADELSDLKKINKKTLDNYLKGQGEGERSRDEIEKEMEAARRLIEQIERGEAGGKGAGGRGGGTHGGAGGGKIDGDNVGGRVDESGSGIGSDTGKHGGTGDGKHAGSGRQGGSQGGGSGYNSADATERSARGGKSGAGTGNAGSDIEGRGLDSEVRGQGTNGRGLGSEDRGDTRGSGRGGRSRHDGSDVDSGDDSRHGPGRGGREGREGRITRRGGRGTGDESSSMSAVSSGPSSPGPGRRHHGFNSSGSETGRPTNTHAEQIGGGRRQGHPGGGYNSGMDTDEQESLARKHESNNQGQAGRQTTGSKKPGQPLTSDELANQMASLLSLDGADGDSVTEAGVERETGDTKISSATLQAIREQITASLQRMRELEEQNKSIPVLQVRVAVLKEEKKLLGQQLRAVAGNLPPGVDPSDPNYDPTRLTNGAAYNGGSTQAHGRTGRGSTRSVGVGESDVNVPLILASVTSMSPEQIEKLSQLSLLGLTGDLSDLETVAGLLGLQIGPDGIPIRVHEKELCMEQNTEVREKEVRTVFIGGRGTTDLLNEAEGAAFAPSLAAAPRKPAPPVVPKVSTRSIGVGSGNVFETTGSNFQVHEKEMRTVYIGGTDVTREGRSTRNVGILCKVAMRDVGMVHFSDHERPMTRNIAVGAGEVGVGEGIPMMYWGAGIGDSVTPETETSGVAGSSEQQAMNLMNTALNQINMAAFQTRHVHVKNEQIRNVIDELLKKEVRSVETQCRFATEDKGTDAERVNYSVADVGVSDDVIDVEVHPKRVMKHVAIDFRPSLFHRACGTDILYKNDMATNTSNQGNNFDRSTNTDKVVAYPASTNTDAPSRYTSATSTEVAVFLSNKALAHAATSVDRDMATCGINTDIVGEVDARSARPTKSDTSTHTSGLISLFDRSINTDAKRSSDKSMMTSKTPQSDKNTSTDKTRTSVAAVNTTPVRFADTSSSPSTSSSGSKSEGRGAEGSLKSIMKTSHTEDAKPAQKKGISFSDDVTAGAVSPLEGDSESETGSRNSLNESSGELSDPNEPDDVTDSTALSDSNEPDDLRADLSDPKRVTGRAHTDDEEVRAELLKACETYSQWLQDSTKVATKELNAALAVIQREWFAASGEKESSVAEIERVLSVVREVSPHLVEPVINIVDSNGNMSLHYAVSNCNVDVIEAILETGCSEVNKRNHSGYTATMLATRAGLTGQRQLEVVSRLFQSGDVNMKSVKGGETALMLAARHGQTDMVALLLEAGATVNTQDDDGSTALMGACENGYTEIVKLLLDQPDIDISIADNDGSTAMSIAMEAKHKDVGVLLYAHENFRTDAPSSMTTTKNITRTYRTTTTSGSGSPSVSRRVTKYTTSYR